MIITFLHKGLELFFETGNSRLILSNSSAVAKISDILDLLNVSSSIEAMNVPHLRLHKLKGKLKDYYAMKVNANWRITFQFDGKNVYNVNLVDYHRK